MRTRPTIVFLIIAIILVVWVFLVERPADETRRLENAVNLDLYDINFDAATEIRITQPTDTLVLTMVDTHWELVSPVQDVAYQGAIGRLFMVLSDAIVDRDLGPTDNRSNFGLAPPEVTITIESPADTLVSLHLGNFTVDKRSVYARRTDEENILMTATGIRRSALYALEDWRNRRVVNFDLSSVTGYTVQTERGSLRWSRDGDRWWTIQDGDSILGDTGAVTAVLRRIRGLRVRRFPLESEYGDRFESATLRVEIRKTPPATPLHLSMIWPDTKYPFVQTAHDGRVVELDSAVTKVFEASVWHLRDKRPVHFDPSEVKRIEVVTPDTTATLVLRGLEWSSPNPSISRFHQGRVRIFLRSIDNLAFKSPPLPSPKPRGRVLFGLVLYRGNATIIDEFTCYEGKTPGTWISHSTSVGTTTISSEAVQRLVERLRLIRQPDTP